MTSAVSIVIPALEDVDLLARALGPLTAEVERRGRRDQILVVDDSGRGALVDWLAKHHPRVDCLALTANRGFAGALEAGIAAAAHPRVFAHNSDLVVRSGFLEPLEHALDRQGSFAAVPRVALDGDEERVESWVEVVLDDGIARARQPALEGSSAGPLPAAVAFPVGGAFLFETRVFRDLGGFDPLFAPFYLEDMDLGWRAWTRGLATRLVADSRVDHHHRGTIGARVCPRVVRAAIERNRLLFTWKHLDDREALARHLAVLPRHVARAELEGDRNFLTGLCLALERLPVPAPRDTTAATSNWRRACQAIETVNAR